VHVDDVVEVAGPHRSASARSFSPNSSAMEYVSTPSIGSRSCTVPDRPEGRPVDEDLVGGESSFALGMFRIAVRPPVGECVPGSWGDSRLFFCRRNDSDPP